MQKCSIIGNAKPGAAREGIRSLDTKLPVYYVLRNRLLMAV